MGKHARRRRVHAGLRFHTAPQTWPGTKEEQASRPFANCTRRAARTSRHLYSAEALRNWLAVAMEFKECVSLPNTMYALHPRTRLAPGRPFKRRTPDSATNETMDSLEAIRSF
jgi:hypothetical protein